MELLHILSVIFAKINWKFNLVLQIEPKGDYCLSMTTVSLGRQLLCFVETSSYTNNTNPGLAVYKNYTLPWQLNLD